MAKKQSYADLSADRDRLDLRAHILEIAATELPDARHIHRDGRDRYIWKAYRLDGMAGGYILGIFDSFINKRPSVFHVERLDAAINQVSGSPSSWMANGLADAVSKFHSERYNRQNPAA